MAIMGLGIGALMQNLVLAVQNTVDVRDIGAASAAVSFFRSLGGAVGVSASARCWPASSRNITTVSSARPGGHRRSRVRRSSTLDLKSMPPVIATIVRAAYGDATGQIFLVAAVVAVVALVAVIFIREVPLRTTVALERPENVAAEHA